MGYIGDWFKEGFCRFVGVTLAIVLYTFVLLSIILPKLEREFSDVNSYVVVAYVSAFAMFVILPTMYLFSRIIIWLFGKEEY